MGKQNLKIGLIQTEVSDNTDCNIKKTLLLAEEALKKGAKIICLQELFSTPYFPQYENNDAEKYAESIPGKATNVFSELAKKYHAVIVLTVYEKADDNRHYNSAIVINSDGTLMPAYHKVHIPYDPLFYEKDYFYPGDSYQVYDTIYGKIGVLICYDQWFPEAARNLALNGAEIIFYPTAIGYISGLKDTAEGDWKNAWMTVQRGHAISNSVYVAAVNRTGREGELEFWGNSFLCDPFGNITAEAGDKDEIVLADIDFSLNRDIREGWGFLKNRRPETYDTLTKPVEGRFLSEGYTCNPKKRQDTPKKLGYRMPAEWERHDAVWLCWPYDIETFFDIESVEKTYTAVVSWISSGEMVNLLVKDENMRDKVRKILFDAGCPPGKINFFVQEYADVWIRDYGPVFVVNRDKKSIAAVDWVFNAWGGKYEDLKSDNVIPSALSKILQLNLFHPGIILEGGSIDVNGKGSLLTTRQCLLNKNRNPHLKKEEIEEYLDEYLGAENVIWLEQGITGDDTDGHIDDVARFVNQNTIICAVEENPDDENYEILRKNFEILKNSKDESGSPLNVIKVPMPGRVDSKIALPASYTNFYIGNGIVIVPVFKTKNDSKALEIIRNAFPDRKVVGIDCRMMVYGLGTIHCVSQQQPSV
ncbi:agmatine deiminase [Methanomicrobium sp. W14]|uniref:agmatine deiminase family protein n=1 Tax=Methanomicrobium sp. W14 TaxID=2817839 RepID=UPI001AE9D478|nr:agmatine deiminase family protein [Methanomicrobium sp. W14]MBP2133719.1 agmatine deiminase [Methanomicrobium sp. W14]